MLDGAFSFRGRIGRLDLFLNGLLMGVAAVVAAMGLSVLVYTTRHGAAGLAFLIGCAGLLAIPFVWFSLSLHVRRIRAIGWDPLVVLVGVFALDVGDAVLAQLEPGLAHGRHGGTIFSGLLNGALSLALLFWPSGDEASSSPPSIQRPGRGPRVAGATDADDPAGRLRPARPELSPG